MKKLFVSYLSVFLLALSFISAEPFGKNNCGCEKCACTKERHCGCFSDKGCRCTRGNQCSDYWE